MTSLALAHPLAPQDWSVWTAVDVHEDRIDVVLVAEVPEAEVHRWIEDGDAASARATAWTALSDGAEVRVDGVEQRGRWAPVWSPANGAVADGTYTYMLRFEAEAPPVDDSAHTVHVRVPGFEDRQPYRTAWTEVRQPWCIVSDSARQILGDRMSAHPAKSAEAWLQEPRLSTLEIRLIRCNETKMKSNEIDPPR